MKKVTRNILFISGVMTLIAFTTLKVNKQLELNEIKFTAEDMIGWIVEDVANGYVTDTVIANTYIDNLEQIINKVEKIKE